MLKKKAMTETELDDKLSNVRGAIMMAYPMGLPSWDILRMALDSVEGIQVRGNLNKIYCVCTRLQHL